MAPLRAERGSAFDYRRLKMYAANMGYYFGGRGRPVTVVARWNITIKLLVQIGLEPEREERLSSWFRTLVR